MTRRAMALVTLLSGGILALACGSSGSGGNTFPGGDDGGSSGDDAYVGTFGDGGAPSDSPFDPDAFWANDPPPMWCGPDGGGGAPPPPGGTPMCPDDKNREGCPCPKIGEMAPCWPGLRANRNLGICKDGTTTCVAIGENQQAWGPCMGYVLPQPGAKLGAAACKCFSQGQWAIANLSPCFVTDSSMNVTGAVSTYVDTSGKAQCPMMITNPPMPQPGTTWSPDTLKADCAGHFKLCYQLKAGMASSPQAGDCALGPPVCTEADYPMANAVTPFPDLPSWTGTDVACAQQFVTSGGYGEMSVIGESVRCDVVDDGSGGPYVFNRVQYCPLACNTNPSGPGCMNCMQGGSGTF